MSSKCEQFYWGNFEPSYSSYFSSSCKLWLVFVSAYPRSILLTFTTQYTQLKLSSINVFFFYGLKGQPTLLLQNFATAVTIENEKAVCRMSTAILYSWTDCRSSECSKVKMHLFWYDLQDYCHRFTTSHAWGQRTVETLSWSWTLDYQHGRVTDWKETNSRIRLHQRHWRKHYVFHVFQLWSENLQSNWA